jgi:glucokinase
MSPRGTAASSALAIGIDVGGTKTALGIVGPDGALGPVLRIENAEAGGPEDLLARVAERARHLASQAPMGTVAGVGVGLPELVDLGGEVRSATSVPWTRTQVLQALAGIAPVIIEADVRAAALAEAAFGAGRGHRSLGFVTVGTGISSCLVLDGRPYPGAHGAAQLLGSTPLTVRCPPCGSWLTVTLEDLAAGPAMAKRFEERTGARVGGAEEVLAAEHRGDPEAKQIVADSATSLGSFLAFFANLMDPEAIVVGGGLGSADGAYWDLTVRAARDHIWAEHVRTIPILRAALGPPAGVIGAGYTALRARTPTGAIPHAQPGAGAEGQ